MRANVQQRNNTQRAENDMTILILPQDGTPYPDSLSHSPCLELLQKWVGGNIQMISLVLPTGKQAQLIVNEDGNSLGLEVNFIASFIYEEQVSVSPFDDTHHTVVGDAVVLTGDNLL